MKEIGKILIDKKETLAVAESVTAGLLQFAFAGMPNASEFFQGGITAYNLGQKSRHLGVEPLHAASVDCVSQKVAREMALAVTAFFTSDWGIGITGYATPSPEGDGKLFAFYAIAYRGKIRKSGKLTTREEDPQEVQHDYARQVLKMLSTLVK